MDPRSQRLKRAMDVAGAAVGLSVGVPLMGAVAIAVYLDLGRPVLFRQARAGRGGSAITIAKFRTMRASNAGLNDAERAKTDAQRLTRMGRWLRNTSLDELPQLWSVLRGDLSLVGPRPLLLSYTPLYNARQRTRLDVKPGLTGLAQIAGRNALTWEAKFELDAQYVERQSLALDLWILGKTAWLVIAREGAEAGDAPTMPAFTGSPASR